jgi:hypothetical protein
MKISTILKGVYYAFLVIGVFTLGISFATLIKLLY